MFLNSVDKSTVSVSAFSKLFSPVQYSLFQIAPFLCENLEKVIYGVPAEGEVEESRNKKNCSLKLNMEFELGGVSGTFAENKCSNRWSIEIDRQDIPWPRVGLERQ